MSPSPELGGAFTPAGTSFALNRIGYGAIQLTGPMAWGPPNDRQAAVAVVREAVRLGINQSIPATIMAPMSPTRSSGRLFIPIPKA
jgi:hypothetical protein